MNKNRVLEILTDKDVIVFYDGYKVLSSYTNDYDLAYDNNSLWFVRWEIVDFSKLAFYRKFDATI